MYKVSKSYKRVGLSSKILTFMIFILMIMSIASFFIFMEYKFTNILNDYQGKIYPGITINNVDMSGLSEITSKESLENKFYSKYEDKYINFSLDDKVVRLSFEELGLFFNIDEVILEAFEYSKNLNYIQRLDQILNPKSINFDVQAYFNGNIAWESISEKLSVFEVMPVNATAKIVDGQVVITEGIQGHTVDKQDFINMINSTSPTDSNLSGSSKEISTKSKEPDVTAEDLLKINGKLSSYTTSYKSSSTARAANVELSANSINGHLLMPGESFSFNNVVGQRTRERGYQDAAIIIGNVYESGLGGGICQTSSTLHQAIFGSGIIPTQRRNHSLPTSYMPLGYDAVVAWGSLDYVFTNTHNFPILIDVSTVGRNLTISIYGDVTQINEEYSTVTEVYESVPFTTKTIYDENLENGKQIVDKNGYNGTKLRVKRVVKDKNTGQVVENKTLWNDYYYPQEKIIRIGTKK